MHLITHLEIIKITKLCNHKMQFHSILTANVPRRNEIYSLFLFLLFTHYKELEIVQFFTHKSWKNVFCWQQHSLPFSIFPFSLSHSLSSDQLVAFLTFLWNRASISIRCNMSSVWHISVPSDWLERRKKWFTGKIAWPASRKIK